MSRPRRPVPQPQGMTKEQVELLKRRAIRAFVPVSHRAEEDKNGMLPSFSVPTSWRNADIRVAEQPVARNTLLSNPHARATNTALAGVPAARSTELTGKQELLNNPKASATNVPHSGINPTARRRESTGQQAISAKAKARHNNAALSGLHRPAGCAESPDKPGLLSNPEARRSNFFLAGTDQSDFSVFNNSGNSGQFHHPHLPKHKPANITKDKRSISNNTSVTETGNVRRIHLPPATQTKKEGDMTNDNHSSETDIVKQYRLSRRQPKSSTSANSDADTAIGPVPVKCPKRNDGKCRRNSVLGLFPSQPPHNKK
ncbi:hypothetical protein IWZ01DRAFT_545933 [Phyllosticta capitalensis]